jgi:hypothetical protein
LHRRSMSAQNGKRPDPAPLNCDSDLGGDSSKEPVDRSRRNSGFNWKTRASFLGIPLINIAYGRDEKGRPMIAKGFVAFGQFAVGVVAIGQFGVGIVGIGQFAAGLVALGQLALSPVVAFGQLSVGTFAIGQFVIGKFARGQFGWAEYLWSPDRADMEAVAMFETIDWLVHQDLATIWENIKDAITLGL